MTSYEISHDVVYNHTRMSTGNEQMCACAVSNQHHPFWERMGMVYCLFIKPSVHLLLQFRKCLKMLKVKTLLRRESWGIFVNLLRIWAQMNSVLSCVLLLGAQGAQSSKYMCSLTGSLGHLVVLLLIHVVHHSPCHPPLALSSTYATYIEFVSEFRTVMAREHSWRMDGI